MPHSTSHSTSHMRTPSQSRSSNTNGGPAHSVSSGGTEKFPDFDDGNVFDGAAQTGGAGAGGGGGGAPQQRWQQQNGSNAGYNSDSRWHARRDSRVKWAPGASPSSSLGGHGRKLSSAINRIRAGSMSQNAHEIADALRAPVSWKLITLCVMWYWSSALTNTSSKSILTAFDKPATLTIVQFGFVSSYCLLFSSLASTFPKLRTWVPALKHPIRYPSHDVIKTTLPLAAFQIGGHLLSSTATSKIPVSLVHTIKGLSPLFTVLAYRLIFDIRYPRATYLSLVPLTLGVMLACSSKHTFGGQFLGILYALLATIIFVTQNIFSKRLFNEAARAEQEGLGAQSRKLDKLNLLCYSSGMAFILTCPIWLWSEGIDIIGDFLWDGSVDLTVAPDSFDHGRLTLEYIFNGTFHFGQNILAFVLLSTVSPVTYSVASLIKRVFVIFIAIIWFRSPTTNVQAVGITLTFLGLYLYDRSSAKNKADQRARSMTETKSSLLPMSAVSGSSQLHQSPVDVGAFSFPSQTKPSGYGYTPPSLSPFHHQSSHAADSKKSDDVGRPVMAVSGGRNRGASNAWLAPGTRAEDTWRAGDAQLVSAVR